MKSKTSAYREAYPAIPLLKLEGLGPSHGDRFRRLHACHQQLLSIRAHSHGLYCKICVKNAAEAPDATGGAYSAFQTPAAMPHFKGNGRERRKALVDEERGVTARKGKRRKEGDGKRGEAL